MTNKNFVASNGITVCVDGGDVWLMANEGFYFPDDVEFSLGSPSDEALAEYFQHKRDEELGHWRDPENPTVVIKYDAENDWAYALDETTWAECAMVVRDSPRLSQPSAMYKAISNFFKAHPKPPKPWEEAKPGEVWELSMESYDPGEYWLVKSGGFKRNAFLPAVSLDSPAITAGYRIWPTKED